MFWTAADIGWVTGHSYIVYGPLANGTTSVMYEGTPDTPARDRWWQIIEKYKVNILYTAPTTIRTFMKWGEDLPADARPLEPAPARVGGRAHQPRGLDLVPHPHRRRPLPDRRHLVADRDRRHPHHAAARHHRHQAGRGHDAVPGHCRPTSSTTKGNSVGNGEGGYLVITEPWPGMTRGIYGDDERFIETYWKRFPGHYFAGDGAKRDEDGDLWLLGRVDDVMNISGHRISTTEVEHALVSHPAVAEAAVVGANDATTGQAIVAFVTVKGTRTCEGEAGRGRWSQELRDHVATRDRPHRQAAPDPAHPRAAQDAQRQDHAPAPARRRRRPAAGRRHDAARPHGGQRHQGPHGRGGGRQGIASAHRGDAGPSHPEGQRP